MGLIRQEGLPKIAREVVPREFSRRLLQLLFVVEGYHPDFERTVPLFIILNVLIIKCVLFSITDTIKTVHKQPIVTEGGKIHL